MQHWATVAVVRGILLVLVGVGPGACTAPGGGAAPAARDASVGVLTHAPGQPPAGRHLRLIVGDTVRVALAADDAGRTAVVMAHEARAVRAARFASNAEQVVAVRDGSLLVARRAGRASITGEGSTITVDVVTKRRATNEVVIEVCPNRDESEILAEEQFTGDVPSIHEYHDCQKLVSGTRYVTVAGIFSPHDLAFAKSRADFTGGRLVAMIVNFGTRRDTATYRPLGLRPGTSCLYLRAVGDSAWEAYVVGQRAAFVTSLGERRYGSCAPATNWATVAAAGRRLSVEWYSGVDMQGRPIAPPVARWDWDSTHAYNHIGVMCGAATWCEIGPDGFDPRPPLFHRVGPRRDSLPILKGYYDEQYLADSTGLRPTRVFGTITPGADTRSHDTMKHGVKQWYHVAELRFRNDGGAGYGEYGRYVRQFTGSSPGNTQHTAASQFLHPQDSPLGSDKRRVYMGRIGTRQLPAGAIMYRFHAPHQGVIPTPTARWRWVELDEKTWSYCNPDGCCEIQTL